MSEIKENPFFLNNINTESKEKSQKSSNDLEQMLKSLNIENIFYKEILKTFPDMLWAKDTNGLYLYANEALCKGLLMCNIDEAIGKTDLYFAQREKEKYKDKEDWHTFGQSCANSDLEVLKHLVPMKFTECGNVRGQKVYLEVFKAPLYNSENILVGTVGVGRDITEFMYIKNKLEKKILSDELTGLKNRTTADLIIDELINRYTEDKKISAILFLDIDNFKNINDDFGHSSGDQFLVSLSQLLLQTCKEINCEIIRYGGDEFIIFVKTPAEKTEDALSLIEEHTSKIQKIVSSMSSAHDFLSGTTITCSIGVSFVDNLYNDVDFLKSAADIALNEAKRMGKNQTVFFSNELRKNMLNALDMEKKIKTALENEEFELYFQPQYSYVNDTFKLTGAEALIRWNTKDGVLTPYYFIDVAEKNGQIIDIGNWVMLKSMEVLSQWKNNPNLENLTLSINVSPKQFQRDNFLQLVERKFNKSNFNSEKLKFELTENVAIEDFAETKAKMNKLIDLGFVMSLDDFGTGYSSLSNLVVLPFKQIKIDKSFVNNIISCKSSKQIIQSIKDIANVGDKNLIVEGIETQEQLDELLKLNIQEFQGYYFSPPVKRADFEELVLQK